MKTLIVILLAAGVACASTFFIVSSQKTAQLKRAQVAWDSEKAQLEAAAKNSPVPVPTEKIITTTVQSGPTEESPQDILNDLLNIKVGAGNERNTALRQVVFKLETLTLRSRPAIPAVRAFIGRNVDVNYETSDSNNGNNNTIASGNNNVDVNAAANVVDASAGNNGGTNNAGNNRRNRRNNGGGNNVGNNGGVFGGFGGGGGNNFRGGARRARNIDSLRTDWVAPPSLRLGLVGSLKEIGGAESEQVLVEMLSSTARGVEVAYLTVVLEEIAPGKYRDMAVGAAKELLMSPPAVDSPDRLDELSKSYLYGVLEYFKDTSFAVNAQQMLVGPDGRLDPDAMDYLSTVMKEQSVSSLYSAYHNSSLTNQFDKMNLGREILAYVGQNSSANQLFTETLNNPDTDTRQKMFTVAQLAGGGFGPFAGEAPTDPQVINSRIQLLNSLQSQFAGDEQMSQVISATVNALQTGQPVDPRQMFGGGRGGGGGGGRRGGAGGGGNNGGN